MIKAKSGALYATIIGERRNDLDLSNNIKWADLVLFAVLIIIVVTRKKLS